MKKTADKSKNKPLRQIKQLHNKTNTAAFFFQEPRSKVPSIRLNTSTNAFKSTAKKTTFYRYGSKYSSCSLENRKLRNFSLFEKDRKITLDAKQFEFCEAGDVEQNRAQQKQLKPLNTKVGSILRALRREICCKLQLREHKSIKNVAILGTKLL